ncbi:MAG: hypothetical protein JOZ77_08725 [Candidatus Eremiobacteraeota bacterium]|nr:hypothetical protein [Candidatus Eremiobacteraeota bacterium]
MVRGVSRARADGRTHCASVRGARHTPGADSCAQPRSKSKHHRFGAWRHDLSHQRCRGFYDAVNRKRYSRVHAGLALYARDATLKSISVDELARRIEGRATPFLLDVRETWEMADGVIPGSVNIPMDDVELRLREVPADRDVVVFCHLGVRSAHITKRLNELGYDRAMNLRGGLDAWLRAFPVSS